MRRKESVLKVIVLLAICSVILQSGLSLGYSSALAAEEALPAGEDVCDRYVEVCGGRGAFDKLENRKVTAVFEMPAQGLTLDLTIFAARPNMVYSLIESPMLGKIERGVSKDEIVWEISMMTGPVVKDGVERANTLRESRFDRLIAWREVYVSAECTGMEKVGEKDCYIVEMTPEEGNPSTFYYEKESGLLVRIKTVAQSRMGDVPTETNLVEHREVDGVLLPWKIVVSSLGSERIVSTTSMEHNIEIPEGTFDIPEEIKPLLEN